MSIGNAPPQPGVWNFSIVENAEPRRTGCSRPIVETSCWISVAPAAEPPISHVAASRTVCSGASGERTARRIERPSHSFSNTRSRTGRNVHSKTARGARRRGARTRGSSIASVSSERGSHSPRDSKRTVAPPPASGRTPSRRKRRNANGPDEAWNRHGAAAERSGRPPNETPPTPRKSPSRERRSSRRNRPTERISLFMRPILRKPPRPVNGKTPSFPETADLIRTRRGGGARGRGRRRGGPRPRRRRSRASSPGRGRRRRRAGRSAAARAGCRRRRRRSAPGR